jgi:hypothetical protein
VGPRGCSNEHPDGLPLRAVEGGLDELEPSSPRAHPPARQRLAHEVDGLAIEETWSLVPQSHLRTRAIQQRWAEAIERIRIDCGNLSLAELSHRAAVPLDGLERAHQGLADVELLEHIHDLARLWPKGDLSLFLGRLLPEDEVQRSPTVPARAVLSPDTQLLIEGVLESTAALASSVQTGEGDADPALLQALKFTMEALVVAANPLAREALTFRDSEDDLARLLNRE